MKKTLGFVALATAAYLLYTYSKKRQIGVVSPIPEMTPEIYNQRPRTSGEIAKVALKKEGAKLIEPYYESEAGRLAEKRFKQSISANDILLFTGEKQYVTLENLIPNRYGQYNNFSGKNYNKLNVEDTTNISRAILTQSLYKRPKPLFNNTL